ncbi:MAG: IclR family transcriptional regulator [Betaproteobacteria bacterium]|nr:IclR family transcriptional regulator [Betaproteobacteria bacterium]
MKRRYGAPGRGASLHNRSLERGLSILRVFRPGASLRGNGEIAELTGLPRSTVSRLTQTLVACRFLEHDRMANAYRLGATVLGLAEAWIAGSDVLPLAIPLMKRISDKLRANVSLAVADGDEMVYLHSVRRRDVGVPRRVVRGHRTPIEMTSLGRAYLATLTPKERSLLLARFRRRYPAHRWKTLGHEIGDAVRQVQRTGYCRVEWLPGITAVAMPIQVPGRIAYLINVGISSRQCDEARIRDEIVPGLLALGAALRQAVERINDKSVRSNGRNDMLGSWNVIDRSIQ